MIYMFVFVILTVAGILMSLRRGFVLDFTVDNTMALRGVLAISIVLFHYHCFFHPRWESLFEDSGCYICGVFFLLSGYGIAKSWIRKGDEYLRHFVRSRLGTLLPVWLAASLICMILRIHYDGTGVLVQLYRWIAYGNTLSYFTWFIDVLVLCYAAFYVSVRLLKQRRHVVIAMWMLTMLQIIAIRVVYDDVAWYISQLAFPMGFTIACYEDLLDVRRVRIAALMSVVAFVVAFFLHDYFGYIVLKIGSITLFSTMLYFAVRCGITFSVKPVYGLGVISLEIYVIHGVILEVMSYMRPYPAPQLFLVMMIFGSIILGTIFHALTARCRKTRRQ